MQHGLENVGYFKRTKTRVPEEKHYWSKDDIDEDHQQCQPPLYGTRPESVGGERSRHSAMIAPEGEGSLPELRLVSHSRGKRYQ